MATDDRRVLDDTLGPWARWLRGILRKEDGQITLESELMLALLIVVGITVATTHGQLRRRAALLAPDPETIRLRAYYKWVEAGRPSDDGVEFWLQAEREICTSLVAEWFP